MVETRWQRSSFCGNGGNNCVELATDGDHIRIRESTAPSVTVTTTPARLGALLRQLKAGGYDRPPYVGQNGPRP